MIRCLYFCHDPAHNHYSLNPFYMTATHFRYLAFLGMLLLVHRPIAFAQMFLHDENIKVGAWELVTEKDSVQVYNRTVEGQALREFKATAVLHAPLFRVVYALTDYKSFPQWMGSSLYDMKAVGVGDKQSYYLYYKIKTPLLSSDRDVILKIEASPMSKGYIFRCKSEPTYLSENPAFVRIQRWDAAWVIENIDDTSVRLSYLGTVNDNERLPTKYAEEMMTKLPYEFLLGLHQFLLQK